MGIPTTFWMHDGCGCAATRAPIIGARYRWRFIDVFTGEDRGWRYLTVTAVDPIRHDKMVCRRVTVEGDDGRIWHPWLVDFWSKHEAVDNVTPFRAMEGRDG